MWLTGLVAPRHVGSSQTRAQTRVPCIGRRILNHCATKGAQSILNLFIYFWLCWVFISVRGLSLVVASGGHSSSRCAGLSLSRPLVAEHRLQTRRLSNCGSRAHLLRAMWDLPRPGLEPVSPALAGRLSTTVPPGKPPNLF